MKAQSRRAASARHAPPVRPVGVREDERAISTVLGAVLVFALFIITLVTIRTQFVPVWQKEREQSLMLDAARALGTLKADLDRQVGNQTAIPVSVAVPLATASGFALFSEKDLPGTMAFTPSASGKGFNVQSNQLTVQSQNGNQFYGIGEQWTAVTGGSIGSIAQIVHLRLRIVDPANVVGNLTFLLTDANGKCAGRLQLFDSIQSGSDNNVEARVYGAASPPAVSCASTPISIEEWNEKKQLSPAYFYWDAFNSDSQFPSVLAAATYPASVSFTASGGLTGDYTIVYDSSTGGSRVGGTGIVVPNYNVTTSAGALALVRHNNEFPAQTYTMEYGAILLDQPDGSAMVVPPQMTLAATSSQVSIGWSVPGLAGGANAVAGSTDATIISVPAGHTSLTAFAPRLYVTLATTHPTLWRDYWNNALVAAGLTGTVAGSAGAACATNVQFSICWTATSATLELFGPTTAVGSTSNDIYLTLATATLSVDVKATGS